MRDIKKVTIQFSMSSIPLYAQCQRGKIQPNTQGYHIIVNNIYLW